MSMLHLNHQQLLRGVNCTFQRYLMKQINWTDRLIGIFGQQGVGKTTLLLQRIKQAFGESDNVWYLSLDNLWFLKHSLQETVTEFCDKGGTHLFLDNIHYYQDWIIESGQLFDKYPNLHIVFAISSLQSTEQVKEELERGVECYQLHTMSFREFLAYESVLEIDPISLDDLLANHYEVVKKINTQINVVPIFRNYLEHGCYPFYWEDPDRYYFRLQEIIHNTIGLEQSFFSNTSNNGAIRARKMLMSIATASPTRLSAAEIMRQTGLARTQIDIYTKFLQDAGFINYPEYMEPTAIKKQKAVIGNTNLYIALFGDKDDRRIMAETFFVNQLSNVSTLNLLTNNDYMVNEQYAFAVGDPLRNYEAIKTIDNYFAAIYGIPRSTFNRMPVWILGFLY